MDRRALVVLAAGVAAVAVALTAWLGWRGVVDRLETLAGSEADNRSADWRVGLRLAKMFPLAGVGGGALPAAEPLVRTRSDQRYEFNTMDNDYLEALVEGGVPRFALTLGLAVAAVGTAVVAARRQANGRDGPLLLGCVFGLAAVALQSAVDFGLHVPSVALAAAVTAAFAAASGERGTRTEEPDAGPAATRKGALLTGGGAYLAAGLVLLAGLLVVLADWRAVRVDGLRSAARAVADRRPPWRDEAIRYLEAAVKIRPNDAAAWGELARTRLAAVADRQAAALATAAGPVAFVLPPRDPPAADPDGNIAAALKAARAARTLQPVLAGPHLQLGTFADRLARSEPAAVHFDRAKRVAGFDPDVWYASGAAAAARGDWPAAFADWRESLTRSPRRLPAIARAAAGRVPPEQFRAAALPDDLELWFAATPFLFPDPLDPRRAEWLNALAARGAAGPEPGTPAGFLAWASALEDLGEAETELGVLRRAAGRFPDEVPVRDRLAGRLEAAELYDEAVPVLEWLMARQPDNRRFPDRLEAARHALKLKADIDRR
jgi:tetratricopeptide (TPR) repeat protein